MAVPYVPHPFHGNPKAYLWSELNRIAAALGAGGITSLAPANSAVVLTPNPITTTGTIGVSAKLNAYNGGDTPSAFTLGIVDSVDAAAWRAAIGAGTSTVVPAALTKSDDTNVTLLLGGTPATALLQATSITVGWSGTLAKTRGGFGLDASTLTGYVKAAGAGAITASATIPYGDLTGTPTIPTGANPTASVGLAAVNGAATTFLRSDGAPALSQAIVPTWTGLHIFNYPSGTQILTGTTTVNANPSGGSDPAHLVDIVNDVSAYQSIRFSTYGAPGSLAGQNNYHFQRARGTLAAPTAVKLNDVFMSMGFRGHNGSGITGSVAAIQAIATEDWTGSVNGLKLLLQATANGSATRRDVLDLNPAAMVYGNSTDTSSHYFYGLRDGSRSVRVPDDYQFEFGGSRNCWTGSEASNRVQAYTNNALRFTIDSNGQVNFNSIHNGTSPQNIASGTYSPTATNVANTSARSATTAQYIRVGNVVTVSGEATMTTSGAGTTRISLSLPIASNFANTYEAAGTLSGQTTLTVVGGDVSANATNDNVELQFTATGATTLTVSYHYTYLII